MDQNCESCNAPATVGCIDDTGDALFMCKTCAEADDEE